MHIRLLQLLFALLLGASANGTVYYLSPSGSDTNNGTSTTTPWKTIARLVQSISSVQPGDQILFARGGTFRGDFTVPNSGTSSAPITVGAYGTGADPIISGSNLVTGWTLYSGSIYKAAVTGSVKHVFVGGARQTLARYPNTGWMYNDQGSTTTLYDNALTQATSYWNGATLVVRSSNWSYDARTVSAFNAGTLTCPAMNFNLGANNWGYFLCNKLNQLDQAGEWFYDAAAGQLYLWAPGGVNPSTLTVEAAVKDRGITTAYNKQYITITGLAFQHQNVAGVYCDGANRVTVSGCTFKDLYHGIRAVTNNSTIQSNTFQRTTATAIVVYGGTNELVSNTLTDIGLLPGLGESTWGYQGIYAVGAANGIRSNRLLNIGYSGIFVQGSPTVERNVITNAVAILNDGGGIHYDNTDGMIVQDNIVLDLLGSLTSSASNGATYYKICHGIYFGNVAIKNSTIQRNTVTNCRGSGIHYDHTMATIGNKVKDNILFNNDIQFSVSDFSNYNGPSAVSPYYMASYNDVISGNTMYCTTRAQLCMKQFNCYNATSVDFGTFTNNKYYNPYTELSIFHHNMNTGKQRYYTMERWQAERSEDVGSTRSPLRLESYSTASELTGNLVANGTFVSNVTGWGGWPTNGGGSRDLTYLDGGALKAYLPNSSQYSEFLLRGTSQVSVTSGQWYRLQFSVQSNVHGIMRAGLKGVSQFSGGNVIAERNIPFDTQRRDMVVYFQSAMADAAVTQFVNSYTEPQYWLDNVDLRRVTVAAIDPSGVHKLYYNDQATAQSYTLPSGCWSDMSGVATSGTFTLQPYTSRVYYKVTGTCGGAPTVNSVGAKVLLGGAMIWSTGLMRENLRQQGLIPGSEPYTAMGLAVENTGATVSAAQLQVTGSTAIVDWILLELRNNNGGYTVAARRAALLRADGTVVAADGSTPVIFTATTVGKYLVVKHRNHLGVMASAAVATNGQVIDFTLTTTGLYGTNPTEINSSKRALWCGEVIADGTVRYAGATNDSDALLVALGNSTTAVIQGYNRADVNMDGWMKYSGAGNDRDFILATVGGVTTAIRAAQLPSP